jgi:hypothetical protein
MEETERPAFKIIEAFAQCYNSDNMRGCSTLLHYPYMDIGVGRITRLEHSSEFKLQRQGHLQIDALIAVQSGNRSVNLAIEASLTAESGRCDQYQGIVQVTHSNDHPGISGWSMIRLEPVPDKTD